MSPKIASGAKQGSHAYTGIFLIASIESAPSLIK